MWCVNILLSTIPELLPQCESDSSFHLPHEAPFIQRRPPTPWFAKRPTSGNLIAFVNDIPIFQAKTRPQRAHNYPLGDYCVHISPNHNDEPTSTFTNNAAQPFTRTRHTRNHPCSKRPRNLHTSHGHGMHRRTQRPPRRRGTSHAYPLRPGAGDVLSRQLRPVWPCCSRVSTRGAAAVHGI